MRSNHSCSELILSTDHTPDFVYRCEDAFINLYLEKDKRESDLMYCLQYIYYQCSIIINTYIPIFRMSTLKKRKHKNKRKTRKSSSKKRLKKTKKQSPPPPDIPKIEEKQENKPLDENGNPFPIENPEGGDPICEGGYKIDYQFDPLNDPINPPFRCIPSLKEEGDSLARQLLDMANNPAENVINIGIGGIPKGGNGSRRNYKQKHESRRRHRRYRRV